MKPISTCQPKGALTQTSRSRHFCFQNFKIIAGRVNLLLLLMIANILTAYQSWGQTTQIFNANGTFTVPAGVTSIKIEAWGGGGAGGGSQARSFGGGTSVGSGGGGGAYNVTTVSVTAGQVYTITRGNGGAGADDANGGNGTASTVIGPGLTFTANPGIGGQRRGGSPGAGGSGFNNGGIGGTGTTNGAGGGGAAGNATTAGAGNGASGTNTAGGAGGAGSLPGGNGGAQQTGSNNGVSGTIPGGGGGGGRSSGIFASANEGGNGANGRIIITYTAPTYKSEFISMNTGAGAWCPGETRNVTVTIKNIGTGAWADGPGSDFNIGVKWNTDVTPTPDSWADYHVRVDAGGLAPGATATYTIPLTASNNQGAGYTTPLSAGTNNITFDVVYEGVSWFGDNNPGVGPGNTRFVSPNITISAIPQGSLLDNTICLGGTGQLTYNSTAGTGPFTIVYNDGVANRTASNVSSGVPFNTFSDPSTTTTYTLVSVTSAAGCARSSGFTDGSATITVNTGASISVQPAPQAKCVGQSVTFNVTASGSSPTYQWRKNGANIAGATAASYTIAAVATGDAAAYSVVVSVNGCGSVTSQPAILTVNARPTASITSNSTVTICNGGTTNITGTVTASGAWTLNLSSGGSATGTGNGTFSISVNPTTATTYTIASLNDANCTAVAGGLTGSTAVTVNPFPTSVTASPVSSTICLGSVVSLTGSAILTGASALTIDNFNGVPTFTATGTPSGNRSQIWQQEISGANVNSVDVFTSPGGGNLMVSTAGTGNFLGSSSVNSILTSGIINTTGFSSLTTLTFNHSYRDGNSSGTGIVEVSTNGGSSWAPLVTYNSNQGGASSFVSASIPFAPYVNMSSLRIRFNFSSTNILQGESWWAVDDILINGVRIPLFSWMADTAPGLNGLPVGAENPATSNGTISVNPTSTTEYTLTATNPVTGCSADAAPILVKVSPAPSLVAPADATLTTSSNGTGNCNTLHAWTHPDVNTDCPTTLTVAYTAGTPAPAALPNGGSVTAGSNASETFSSGVTIITYTATDQNDNTATTSFTVTVTDDEVPVITCAPNVSVPIIAGTCQATITLTAPATSDNCGVLSVTNDHPSNVFPLGKTFVTWTVTDINNNTAKCEQLVEVEDTEAPTITCAAPVIVNNDPGVCRANITLTAPATADNCEVADVTNDHSSTEFPVGKTFVTWTVTDNSGNTATCEQLVEVIDNELPKITCASSLAVNTDPASAYATLTLQQPVVTDNCGIDNTVNDHSSNQFPIGTTQVTWTTTDVNGNTNTCVQTIVVNDAIQPSISVNANIAIANTPGYCEGATDIMFPDASDNSGHVTVTSDYSGLGTPSVDPVTRLVVNDVNFPVGSTTIIWTATDPSNNTSWSTQMVSVTDNEKPTITCPPAISKNNDPGLCTATITLGSPVTADNCGVLSVANDHPGNTYPVGVTIVTWTVTDIHNNSNTCTQTVTVTDTEIPTITSAPNVNVTADNGKCSADITLTLPTTGDNCGVASVSSSHPSTIYPVGSTTVTWTVTDIHGNTNTSTQTVLVTDNELPVIVSVPRPVQTADAGKCGASVYIDPAVATDNCGVGSPVGTRSDGLSLSADYPVGSTTITWAVTDIHSNAAVPVSQTITITDNEIPVITAAANISVNSDAGQCGAAVTIVPATAVDNCEVGAVTGTRSDALALNASYPVGTTTITWTVTDIHGNVAAAVQQTVTVTDNEIPVLASPVHVNVSNDAGECAAMLSIDPIKAVDNCAVNTTIGSRDDGLELTEAYPVGTTIITWTVTDIHGNAAVPVNQTVTVTDDELPVITASPDITQTADAGQCGAVLVIAGATATDNCGVGATTGTRSDGLPLEDPYPVGTTTITWIVSDIHGNDALPVVQTITITDNEIPLISAGDDIEQTADEGACGALITIMPATATDNCSVGAPTGTRSDNLPLNAAYPVGTTTITWKVADIHGNAAVSVIQTITISDDELPVITASPDISQTADAGKCSAVITIIAATATDNCSVGAATGTRSDGLALNKPYPVGLTTITWEVTDVNGNAAIVVSQTVTVTDDELPVITAPADITKTADPGKCSAAVAITDATATDNCGVGPTTGTRSDGLPLSDPYPVGTTTIAWTVTDIHNNSGIYKSQTIIISDNELPVISTCPPSVTVIPNNAGCTSVLLDYRSAVVASDNCGMVTLTQSPVAGTPLPLGSNTVTITALDAHGNSSTCNFIVTVNKTLNVTVGNTNPQLYYGYALDQSTVITGTPTGGVGPYKVVITMNRILGCNAVNSTGDEKWVATGGTTTGNTCPTAGTAAAIPVSTLTNVPAGGSYSVTATLMANAIFTVTITDANGCTVSKQTTVYSEDARCFAGNSGNTKIKVCHRTGNSKDPCHELCVAPSAVQAHLDHGDFLGTCTTGCIAPPPPPVSRAIPAPVYSPTLDVKVMPNPTPTFFNVVIKGRDASPVTLRVVDVYGRTIQVHQKVGAFSTIRLGDKWPSGTYMVEVFQGTERKVIKVIKAK